MLQIVSLIVTKWLASFFLPWLPSFWPVRHQISQRECLLVVSSNLPHTYSEILFMNDVMNVLILFD